MILHDDHLNTPRLITNNAQQAVWRWDQQEPFGVNVPDENPSGLGAFEFPLRFPGQYFDKETNLHYNYFRDYDPAIGRYAESDPIGLNGGLNTYAYVHGAPLVNVDPRGLGIEDLIEDGFRRMCGAWGDRRVRDWTAEIERVRNSLGPCQRRCYIACFFIVQSPLGQCPHVDHFEIFPYNDGCRRQFIMQVPSTGNWDCRRGVITGRSDDMCCRP